MRPIPRPLAQALERGGHDLGLLVIRLGALGDILRTIPAIRLLRRALPRSHIRWLVEERWRDVLEDDPDLNGLLVVPRRDWEHSLRSGRWFGLVSALGAFRRQVRLCPSQLSIDFHGNLRSGILTRLCGAPVRVGYTGHQQKEGNRLFQTHHVPSGDRRTPRMERNLDPLRMLGLPVEPFPEPALPLATRGGPSADRVLDALDTTPAGFAVISPGASVSQSYKKPPAELLSAACGRLLERGVLPLVVYGPGELEDARAVVQRSRGAALAPPTDLATLAALLSRARLFVGGDSGPLHLACATGCPVLGIYGPTDPQVNRPWGVPYRVVHPEDREYTGIKRIDRELGGFTGMKSIQIDTAVDQLLPRGAR